MTKVKEHEYTWTRKAMSTTNDVMTPNTSPRTPLATVDDPISTSTCHHNLSVKPLHWMNLRPRNCGCAKEKVRLKYLKIIWTSIVTAIYSFPKNARSWAHTLSYNPRSLKKIETKFIKQKGRIWCLRTICMRNSFDVDSESPLGPKE
jgi:hypothetical protein